LRLAVFDLTDCEGCELQFLALREKLTKRGHDFEISNWRLLDGGMNPGPFDVTFIEGSPITEADIEITKRARAVSAIIITLGTCASHGGVQSSLPASARVKALEEIYGPKYKTTTKAPRPVSYYIKVDIDLPGCPINPVELENLLSSLFVGRKFEPAKHPVCLDCKIAGNVCLFIEEGYCLGPVTKGGCGAPCPKAGLPCYGCFGPVDGANLSAMNAVTERYYGADNLKNSLELLFKQSDEYKGYQATEKNKRRKSGS
jgi:coenzyme F420-reducing hydrogenase gamma subunit